MGLDMYLSKHIYVKRWDHNPKSEQFEITVKKGGQPFESIKPERISYVVEEVAYWRKANAIHRWFVEHVQNGEDDCRDYYVTTEQLEKLLNTCQTVVEHTKLVPGKVHVGTEFSGGTRKELYEDGKIVVNPEIAEEYLPSIEGFFFGSTQYDEYYIKSVQHTIELLKKILSENNDHAEFYYRSSW